MHETCLVHEIPQFSYAMGFVQYAIGILDWWYLHTIHNVNLTFIIQNCGDQKRSLCSLKNCNIAGRLIQSWKYLMRVKIVSTALDVCVWRPSCRHLYCSASDLPRQWVDHWSLHADPKQHPCKNLHAPQGAAGTCRTAPCRNLTCTEHQFTHQQGCGAPATIATLHQTGDTNKWRRRRGREGVRREHGKVSRGDGVLEEDAKKLNLQVPLVEDVPVYHPHLLLLELLLSLPVTHHFVCRAHQVP